MKYHRGRIGSVDTRDGGVIGLADRKHTLWRVDDAIVARLDVGRGEGRPVVKQHIAAQLESVRPPVGRDAPGFSEVTHDLWIIRRIEFEQCRVVRNNRMDKYKREIGVTVVVRRFGVDCKHQSAAPLRDRLGAGRALKRNKNRAKGESQNRFRPNWGDVIARSTLRDEAISIRGAQSGRRLLRSARNDSPTMEV